jgi:site-specific recombinase XerD
LRKHAKAAGIDGKSFGPHALRATAATNALDRGADLAQSAGVAQMQWRAMIQKETQ